MAELKSSTKVMLPKTLQNAAVMLAEEPCWPALEALQIVEWFAAHGYEVVGVEGYQSKDGKALFIASSDYSPRPDDKVTSDSIARYAHKASVFIAKLSHKRDIFFNIAGASGFLDMNMPSELMNKLLKLLTGSEHDPMAQQLLQEMPDNQGLDASNPIPWRQVRDIYRQRARHIERIGYPTNGFPELVSGLEAFGGDEVTIFQVRFDTGDYAVFADSALSELAGVLKFPKKTAAQEAALEDSQKQHDALLAASRLQAAS